MPHARRAAARLRRLSRSCGDGRARETGARRNHQLAVTAVVSLMRGGMGRAISTVNQRPCR